MFDASRYTIIVRKGEFDEETCFEATVRELPDVAEYGDTADEAYALALDTVEVTHAALTEQGRCMPVPYAPAKDFSGRVTLRLPRSLHRALDAAANAEGVSLNQHIVNVLNYWSGYAARATATTESATAWQRYPDAGGVKQRAHLKVVSRNDYPKEEVDDVACQ
ncbi:hypothetical protein PC39_08319 [Salinisphaera sp. PC39]